MKELVKLLSLNHKTISVMESCTGGGLANAITNIEGASDIISFGAVTYSNKAKIKMGVNKKIIEKYSVYSIEVANEMSKNISNYTNSNYGIGVTGQLKRKDPNNKTDGNGETSGRFIKAAEHQTGQNTADRVHGQNGARCRRIADMLLG